MSYTDEERRPNDKNIQATFDFCEQALDDLSLLDEIPDGSTVIFKTGDAELDEQNRRLAAEQAGPHSTVEIKVPQTDERAAHHGSQRG